MQNRNKLSELVEVNGRKQFLSIRSSGTGRPLLLYLHGGPGDAALPLAAKYNCSLEDYFTVVIWEQRGTGKSYYRFGEEEDITISLFIKDIYSITEYLLHKYNQKKLYLAGHSWGSVLGLKFCQQYPEKVHTYIGCGQVVNMKKGSRIACQYAMEESEKKGNMKALNRLKGIDCTYSSESWLSDLLFVTRQVVKYKGSLCGHHSYAPFARTVLFSSEYTLLDLINRQKGSMQSIKRLWPELMEINFESITALPVPIVFVEGRHDYHVSSNLAKEYFNTIVTPKSFFWFENSCHFPQWSEADKFTEVMRSILKSADEESSSGGR